MYLKIGFIQLRVLCLVQEVDRIGPTTVTTVLKMLILDLYIAVNVFSTSTVHIFLNIISLITSNSIL